MKNSFMRFIDKSLENLRAGDLRRYRKMFTGPTSPEMIMNNNLMLMFCSNDYLGLANHPRIKDALVTGIEKFGCGSGASHLISGHHQLHQNFENDIEDKFNKFFGACRALLFSSGYMANLAVVTSITMRNKSGIDKSVSIFSEELNHASLIDGIRLARQQNKAKVSIFPHNDLELLEEQMKKDTSDRRVIVTDGVFSMDGTIATLGDLIFLAEKYDALLLVDDAHGFGVLGEQGLGIMDYFNLRPEKFSSERFIYVGTLGKAAGLSGAFVVASPNVVDWIIQFGRTYIYTTASPPFLAMGLRESLMLILEGQLRETLMDNIRYFKENMASSPIKLMPSNTAIQPIIFGENAKALMAQESLLKSWISVPAIRPPTVPQGTSRLRVTLSAAHSVNQIDDLMEKLIEIGK